MIFHYLNLVCWDVADSDKSSKQIYYCDSRSLQILSRLFGVSVPVYSGISGLNDFLSQKDRVTLVSNFDHAGNGAFVLDYRDFLNDDITDIVTFISDSNAQSVGIGVSSPLQNHLARRLSTFLPDVDFYCLGAALNLDSNAFLLRSPWFKWLYFYLRFPYRSTKKLFLMINTILSVVFSKSTRIRFKSTMLLFNR